MTDIAAQKAATLPAFRTRVLPVVVVDDADHAVDLARALWAGGIDAIEVTLRSDAALAAIERIARHAPEVVVGAGTVLSAQQLHQARDAGARFALSPGCTPALLQAALSARLPFVPGVATPSEAMRAAEAGYSLLKFFPAESLGGPDTLRAWAGPLPHLRWCPTGGITAARVADYLALPTVAMVGGSWLTPRSALQAKDWGAITALARDAVQRSATGAAAPQP
ncbi:bifunctional 4-hydroxy-2-oxoglutarate aldolase/2-dehydro-3-deoxy-phosphogluconate aldolase [Tepidimonas taiwanensis]|uniref:2-dehydro-3-deoxy-phosphogluconate aldolase n=1 Tax=Tepidimonas taiwanensis TaxID=307486 RepID=A0A554XA09_9BURK|nr:bifunctional 4-hydroxy-2-oxoglutarate aldolase/2-dehydro-3-deoxy-phosphogluconate aldolase [Tepidimonas taiwanensis]MCX7693070.1 bifunctional 4-hydroxy-2-oxoglutarate aldolase/2-dehydro-3-deoxy-phosphogluconate aldolase [Tepidimonas taiwanensis]TSE32657.1 KHG/KDPG aldolase [Tepidimonas taiwanensis]UBQ05398.1 bifunctional 4-hydroxy-2-oxoglutarate aldolase/2-dehydro-3-deoxy-phosphogluconate aldolase [Tepidimonas taiwanensis]